MPVTCPVDADAGAVGSAAPATPSTAAAATPASRRAVTLINDFVMPRPYRRTRISTYRSGLNSGVNLCGTRSGTQIGGTTARTRARGGPETVPLVDERSQRRP